jgi:hypothetical protein
MKANTDFLITIPLVHKVGWCNFLELAKWGKASYILGQWNYATQCSRKVLLSHNLP